MLRVEYRERMKTALIRDCLRPGTTSLTPGARNDILHRAWRAWNESMLASTLSRSIPLEVCP